jgi:hypothetical protein
MVLDREMVQVLWNNQEKRISNRELYEYIFLWVTRM